MQRCLLRAAEWGADIFGDDIKTTQVVNQLKDY